MQDHIQPDTEHLHRWQLPRVGGNLLQCFTNPTVQRKKDFVFPYTSMEFLVFQFVPISSHPVTGIPLRRIWFSSFAPSCRYHIKPALDILQLQDEPSQLSQPPLICQAPLHHLHSPLLDSLHSIRVSLELGSPEQHPELLMYLTSAK